jgi:uncharacterized cupin superfamily protein
MTADLFVFRDQKVEPLHNAPFFEEVLEGNPSTITSILYRDEERGVISGVWQATPGKWRINYKVWEFCHILSGRCVIEIEGKEPVELRAGDAFIVEPGARGTWTILETMEKHFVINTK